MHHQLEQYGKEVVKKLKNGSLKQFGNYTYYDGQYLEGNRIVSESEIKQYVYKHFKIGGI